jgi:hypothetical protein
MIFRARCPIAPAIVNAVLNVALLFALGCVVLYAIAKAVVALLNAYLPLAFG